MICCVLALELDLDQRRLVGRVQAGPPTPTDSRAVMAAAGCA
jgi:hypothetical protein